MIDQIYTFVAQQLQTNELFAGGIGVAAFGALLYSARALPGRLWSLALRFGTAEVTIYHDDRCFEWISAWFAQHPYSKTCRRLQLSSQFISDMDDEPKIWLLSPGAGKHLFCFHGIPMLLTREVADKSEAGSARRMETYHIRSFGRSQEKLRQLVTEAYELTQQKNRVEIHLYGLHGWQCTTDKTPREFSSVILPAVQSQRILDDLSKFFSSSDWYRQRGVPYRRGYLLSGPPGCGKTSLAFAIASKFRRPLYVLNLGSFEGDSSILSAFSRVPANAVLLIEDIDGAPITHSRADQGAKKKALPGVTLSAILNALDGVIATDGRLLIMTSNYPEKLDAALIRNGRVDRHETILPLTPPEVQTMFGRFFPSANLNLPAGFTSIPAVELQEILMSCLDCPENVPSLLEAHRQRTL